MRRTIKDIDGKANSSADNESINIRDTPNPSTESTSQHIQQTVHHIEGGQAYIITRDNNVEGYQEEINGYSDEIHYRTSHSWHQDLQQQ